MAAAELKQLKRRRGAIKQKMTCFISFLEPVELCFEQQNSLDEKTLVELQLRIDKLEPILNEFDEIQVNIETLCDDNDVDNQYKERAEFSELYTKYLAAAKFIMSKLVIVSDDCGSGKSSDHLQSEQPLQVQSVQNSSDLSNVKLPTISLPKFNSEFSMWLEFKDTFESLIHNNRSIGNIQKFHYLRATLGTESLKIIQSLEFSANNYNIAWELLCSRFDNSHLLVNNHIKSMFNVESLGKESASGIRNLIDSVNKHLRALKTLKEPTECWDSLIIFIVASKLDKITAREWEKLKVEKQLVKFSDLECFLKNKANFLETLDKDSFKETREKEMKKGMRHLSLVSTDIKNPNCNFCNQSHLIYVCKGFLNLTIPERWEKIKELKLCSNCLCKGHFSKNCRAGSCKSCKAKHSTLLHQNQGVKANVVPPIQNDSNSSQGTSQVLLSQGQYTNVNEPLEVNSIQNKFVNVTNDSQLVTLSNNISNDYVLLSTAIIKVCDSSGNWHKVKAILDSGSQSCFISEGLSRRLNLQIYNANISVLGINNITSTLHSKCNVSISSLSNDFSAEITCFILPRVTDKLPSFNVDVSSWKIPKNIQLADPTFNVSSDIDLLIGANLFWNVLQDGKISLGDNQPVLQNTIFGFVISGPISHPLQKIRCNFIKNQTLHDDLKKFWEIEELNHFPILSDDDRFCEEHFKDTMSRNKDGKFVVRIPLKQPISELGDSKTVAIKRLMHLEKRFTTDPDFKGQYIAFMNEYENLHHMSLISEDSDPSYYLPHHGVIREDSLTTKLRVVFDGSAKTSSGKSLNDIQFPGPAIQNDLLKILLRFRQHEVVVTSDINKMYRQVLIHPEDRCLQKIVWRVDPNQELSVFKLNTVTYGTSSAPYLAIRSLKQVAIENKKHFPIASQIILDDFYVDDLITGFSSEEQAIQICKEISQILQTASFNLRKWASNSSNLLRQLHDDSDQLSVLNLGDKEQIKTLGIQWGSKEDTLSYHIKDFPSHTSITKRTILSAIAKIYDPLGLVSPCIILVKILIQRLWTLKLDWDDEIPHDLQANWIKFRGSLVYLNQLSIPRHAICIGPTCVELHGFCDASQSAYSAVIYLKSIDAQGSVQVSLLCAKTKVSPLKVLTIPRLELCGALMLARLAKVVSDSLTCQLNYYFWCDSQVVLHWINTQPSSFQVFVGNRVSEIQNLTDVNDWYYVNTKENPADLASRGIFPNDLLDCQSWWKGPFFLYDTYLKPKSFQYTLVEIPEMRKLCHVSSKVVSDKLSLFDKYSNLKKLNRVYAYCLRFIFNVRKRANERHFGPLSVYELEVSMLSLVKLAQNDSFSNEISILQSNKDLKSKHRLLALTPFIDSNGLLRVGGRLKHAPLQFDSKHPLLLDGKHKLTRLIFEQEHIKLLHAAPQLLLSSVRKKYWATSGMNTAKSVVRNCLRCFRYKPRIKNSIMADLPESRVQISSPFFITGLDYAGPFTLKDRKGRGSKNYKAYICLFICFWSKAVHLELVTDLTTESFLTAFRRFAARRGKPAHLYSDNATNFTGAQKELKVLYDFISKSEDEFVKQCANEGIVWHFIPPNSPNFGGLWESNIKNVKYHLYRSIGMAILTYEEFNTILVQIEATLNSRPLYPMSSDPNDLEPLTPFHFLIGRSVQTVPDPLFEENVRINQLSRFQLLQQITQSFWRQWSQFYLTQLQQRNKWKQLDKNIEVGTLVLIKQDNLPACKWLLGRVSQVHPGDDGIVRVVTINTANSVLKRAVSKVCPIPMPNEDDVPKCDFPQVKRSL